MSSGEEDELDETVQNNEATKQVVADSNKASLVSAGGPSGTKKKKKSKNKKNAAAADGGGSSSSSTAKWSDEEFDLWVKKALEATSKQVDGVPADDLLKLPKQYEGYVFTGSLRPAYITPQMKMPPTIKAPDYAITGRSPSEENESGEGGGIHIHSAEEIKGIRKACVMGREVLDLAGRYLKAGVTGDEIDRLVYFYCLERSIYPSPLNYYEFKKSVCVSANEIICHGIPDCRPIKSGDIINIDVSVFVDGYHADLNETFLVGEVDEEGRKLVRTAFEALKAASKMIKPGTFYRDVGAEISKVAKNNGCAVVKKYCGHGVGRLFHCAPNIPHYAGNKAVGIMKAGHVFTIEPMLNLGTNGGDDTWPDKWTAVTKDGKRSSQFEHTFLVTETGCEILTARPGSDKYNMIWNDEYERYLQR